jgi:hypothetical protein
MAISVVNSKQTGASTSTLTITSATASNLLVALVAQTGSASTITGSDNISGSTGWTVNATPAVWSSSANSLWLAYKTAAGSETSLNPTAGSGGTIVGISYLELHGAAIPGSLDGTPVATSNSTNTATQTSGAVTTTNAGDIIFGAMAMSPSDGGSNAWTGTGPMTLVSANATLTDGGYYIPGSTLSSATFTANWTTARAHGMLVAAIKPASSAVNASVFQAAATVTATGGTQAVAAVNNNASVSQYGAGSRNLSIDNSAAAIFSVASSGTVTLSTSLTNDVIVVIVGFDSAATRTVTSITDNAGLSWTKRSSLALASDGNSYTNDIEVWWAISTGTLSSDSITAHLSGSIDDATITAIAINGANTSSPWDTNAGLPATARGIITASNATLDVSTTAVNTMLLGFVGNDGHVGPGSYHGWIAVSPDTSVPNADQSNGGATHAWGSGVAYQIVSSAQTNTALTLQYDNSTTGGWYWNMIGDAIVAGSSAFLSVTGGTQAVSATAYTYTNRTVAQVGANLTLAGGTQSVASVQNNQGVLLALM